MADNTIIMTVVHSFSPMSLISAVSEIELVSRIYSIKAVHSA
jgi:hypothetical protein